jgi:hypothetical protein
MTRVFIGGSRRITRLNAEVRRRLDRIIERRIPIVIGDANGADRAVQQYLRDRGYGKVEVFCMEGACRNNVGDWTTKAIPAPQRTRGSEYYAIKDEEMTKESTVGFMLWDGKSKGTLANISRLVEQGKKVVVYVAPTREFRTLAAIGDWESLLCQWSKNSNQHAKRDGGPFERRHSTSRQARIF